MQESIFERILYYKKLEFINSLKAQKSVGLGHCFQMVMSNDCAYDITVLFYSSFLEYYSKKALIRIRKNICFINHS